MGSSIKENATRDILAKENPNILMNQETKTNNQETENIYKKKIRNYEGEAIQATGVSGGICTTWKKGSWELIKYKKDHHWIQTDLMKINTKERYSVINIYAPNHYKEKE